MWTIEAQHQAFIMVLGNGFICWTIMALAVMVLDNGFICWTLVVLSLSQCLLLPLFCDCNVSLDFWGSSPANAQNANVYLVPMGTYEVHM